MSFIDDKEKMNDIEVLTKDEFLKSYSYITEEEYTETFYEFAKGKIDEMVGNQVSGLEDLDIESVNLILQNEKDVRDIYVLVSDRNEDRIFLINIFYPKRTESTPSYDFSYSDYLYEPLANGFKIVWMNENVHPILWEDLTEGYEPEDVKEDRGMQKYLEYCVNNGITHEKVDSESFHCKDALQLYVGVAPKKYTTIKFLQECKEMIQHNIFCYSDGYLISKPKEEYKRQWDEEHQKLKIVDKLLNEEREKLKVGKSFER